MRPSKSVENMMEIAKKEALKSVMFYKHGAVIFRGQEVLSAGHNYDFGQHTLHGKFSVHAEVATVMNAINAKKDIKGASMVVVRIAWKRNKEYVNSKPCNNCANFIIKNELGTVFYTTS